MKTLVKATSIFIASVVFWLILGGLEKIAMENPIILFIFAVTSITAAILNEVNIK